ncbi:HAD-IA family hydrolase [Alphaproteobacteria bacterium endosymbiont of Tiliacea citrago]|uniref:HAD-IA family hydrolase n=1 Tax=Alphaproteobacteria bacterium endosymbiont of Tiliacea citrago TaxID=3077944 RepID=UPI00313C871A
MNFKFVFWDWMETLFSDSLLYNVYLKNLIQKGEVSSDLDFDNLNFKDAFFIKTKLKKNKGVKIPYAWFLVNDFLKSGAIQVVVSNGTEKSILRELKDFNPFDLILTCEQFDPKPSLSMFEYAMNQFNFHKKDEILLIGDSFVDQKVAQDLGISFFKINDPYLDFYNIAKNLNFI